MRMFAFIFVQPCAMTNYSYGIIRRRTVRTDLRKLTRAFRNKKKSSAEKLELVVKRLIHLFRDNCKHLLGLKIIYSTL